MELFVSKLQHKLLQFITVQLFLTIVALPILVAWGLPSSMLAPIGNLIFSPFLTAFLFLSSIIFFAELCYIPNGWFITALEWLTALWQQLLKLPDARFLYACKKPSWVLLIIIGIAPFIIIAHPRLQSSLARLASLSSLFMISWALLFMPNYQKTSALYEIPCNNAALTLIDHNSQTILIDPGYLGKKIGAQSYVSFTLVPDIIAKTGRLTIDHLILQKPGSLLFEAIQTLITKVAIKIIYLPYINGEWEPRVRKQFNRMYALLKKHNVTIQSISTYPLSITQSGLDLTITPLASRKYHALTYPGSQVSGSVDNYSLNIYDALYAPINQKKGIQ